MVPIMSQTKTALIKLLAPKQLKQQLQQLSDERHISLSSLVRLILTEYLKKQN